MLAVNKHYSRLCHSFFVMSRLQNWLANHANETTHVFVGVLLDFSSRSTKSYIAVVYRFMRVNVY